MYETRAARAGFQGRVVAPGPGIRYHTGHIAESAIGAGNVECPAADLFASERVRWRQMTRAHRMVLSRT
jgi:hypothetical protein